MLYVLSIILSFLAILSPADSTAVSDDSAALQNAESAGIPREIPIGLPETGLGATIMEDGTRMTHSLVRDYFHWAGGAAYSSTRVMSLVESVLQAGEVGMIVDSRSRTGGSGFSGSVSARTSTSGLIRFDGWVGGPISKGWHYGLGAYLNLDPTSVNSPTRTFVDNKQVYKAVLTKRWTDKAELSLMGKLSFCSDNPGNAYSKAPYIYNGDGTISLLNGFRLGRDCYFPSDDRITYKDVITGEMRSGNLAKMDDKVILDFHADGRLRLDEKWTLLGNLQVCATPRFSSAENSMGGVVEASSGNYSLEDGSPVRDGYVQLRLVTPHDM